MREKQIDRIIKFLLILALICLVLFISLVLYQKVFYPAKLSVQSACMDISEEDVNEMGYYTSGSFTVNCSDSENIQTNITIVDETDKRTLKHELIHENQYFKGNLYGCNNKLGKYLNEVEAYTFSYLPDKIFYRIYDEF